MPSIYHGVEMSTPSPRHLLVTGGAGFIGSAFVRERLKADPDLRITVLDKLTYAGSEENLGDAQNDPRLRFVHGDICQSDAVDRLARDVDAIVNFAAESHVDRSLLDAGAFVQTDVHGTYVLLEAARKYGHQRFLQVSTDEVYGHLHEGRSREDDRLQPRSPYSATKVGAEMLVHAYHVSFGLATLVTRGSNTYGPYQFPEKIIPLFITNALQDLPLPIYGDGSAVRDYLYVDDHVGAIAIVLAKGEPGGAYNVGVGAEVSGVEVARSILEFAGKPASLMHFVKDRPGHDYRYALNVDRIRPLGWQPRHNFRDGLQRTVEWYQRNEGWWRRRKESEFWNYYQRNYQGLPPRAVPQ
jgi:dTDP-glucose 4,6-dehydratase